MRQRKDRKPFYLYLRRSTGVYYCEIRDPVSGRMLPARSTRQRAYRDAERVAWEWALNGIPTGYSGSTIRITDAAHFEEAVELLKSSDLGADETQRLLGILKRRGLIQGAVLTEHGPEFVPWLIETWDWESSPYVREKIAHGQRISRRRCLDAVGAINKHWDPAFAGRFRDDITRDDLRGFAVSLYESGLSAGSVNKIMTAGTVPLRWAALNEIIRKDPTQGLKKFAGQKRTRGILSESEAAALFALPWDDERSRVGNLLASRMGLRAGEILALRGQDLGAEKLHVRHSWSATDGLKGTKSGQARHLLWAPGIREELINLANVNQHGNGPGMYVFWSTLPDRPMDNHVLLDGLKEQFIRLKAGKNPTKEKRRTAEELRQDRNIVVHSWRHYTAAQLKARGVPQNLAMDYMGHGSREVFEVYADHQTEVGDKILANSMGWDESAEEVTGS